MYKDALNSAEIARYEEVAARHVFKKVNIEQEITKAEGLYEA